MTGSPAWVSDARKAGIWVFLIAVVAYVNALGNGFALDDAPAIVTNPVVSGGLWGEALLGPYWHGFREGAGLYRPVTTASWVLEWRIWAGSAFGFHLVSVLVHALVSVAVFALLVRLCTVAAALAASVLFAVHPVHVEAVANVVGRSELYAALAAVGACLVYLAPALRVPSRRPLRLALLAGIYLLGLGSKESAVMIPALLVVVEALRADGRPFAQRVVRESAVWGALLAVLGGYLLVRVAVLGAVAGGAAAPELLGLTDRARVLVALSIWPEYLRLLLAPVSLSSDYSPAVLLLPTGIDAAVVSGGAILGGLLVLVVALRRTAPLVSAGMVWLFVALLPVSNLLFPAGIVLAERTLYLPSVGGALVVAGAWAAAAERSTPRVRQVMFTAILLVGAGFLARTVDRNPSWFSTYTVMSTLAEEHPESAVALRARANGLERVGERHAAAQLWRTVLALQPRHYGFLLDGSRFFYGSGETRTAEDLARRALALRPHDPAAYSALAGQYLREGRGRDAHRVALEGLARGDGTGAAGLWALVAEAYIAKGDLHASLRARRAALGHDPTSASDWRRLADTLEALGRVDEAAEARARAATLPPRGPATPRSAGEVEA